MLGRQGFQCFHAAVQARLPTLSKASMLAGQALISVCVGEVWQLQLCGVSHCCSCWQRASSVAACIALFIWAVSIFAGFSSAQCRLKSASGAPRKR